MSARRVLVTGASGFLGGALVERFSSDSKVLIQGNRRVPPGGARVDLRDPDAARAMLDELRPDVVVHAAAYREPDFCEQNPGEAARLNRDAVEVLSRHLRPDALFVFISTDYVFSGENPPYVESDPPDAVNVYGRLKSEAETFVRERDRHLVIRIPVLVGADPDPAKPGFLTQMLQDVRAGEPKEIDNVLVRHPVWIRDVAENLAWLVNHNQRGTWHFSTQNGGTRHALTLRVAKLFGLDASHLRPSTRIIPRPAPRPLNSALDPAKLLAADGPGFREMEAVFKALGLEAN